LARAPSATASRVPEPHAPATGGTERHREPPGEGVARRIAVGREQDRAEGRERREERVGEPRGAAAVINCSGAHGQSDRDEFQIISTGSNSGSGPGQRRYAKPEEKTASTAEKDLDEVVVQYGHGHQGSAGDET
jgi:hypothetical protein